MGRNSKGNGIGIRKRSKKAEIQCIGPYAGNLWSLPRSLKNKRGEWWMNERKGKEETTRKPQAWTNPSSQFPSQRVNGSQKTLTMAMMLATSDPEAPTHSQVTTHTIWKLDPSWLPNLHSMKKRKDLQLHHFHDDFPTTIPPSNSSRKSRRLVTNSPTNLICSVTNGINDC